MKQIEEKARALLRDVEAEHLPINVTKVAKHLGIVVVKEPFGDDLSGVLIRSEDGPVIGVNKAHSVVRQRFSIAHEIAHYYLKHVGEIFVHQAVLNKRDGRSAFGIDRQEIEANAFAAALLMPAYMVEQGVVEFMKRNPLTTLKEVTTTLAGKFLVSQQAMGYRLINLGLAAPSD